ncbi:MAG: 4-(cytidine 5'-diphospho)-2-C-methyl-D-erythritol kinase [Clostridia bacterium]|nr:4-(cytidine 5'-diphospho)-2-C-methyl-D-erythritol kinase [Clostridia bacterium]
MIQKKDNSLSRGRVTRPAYAKINLYLDVLSCREDGFHDLLTVMHSISLHDDIRVEWFLSDTTDISLRVYGAKLPLDSKNLAYRAAELFLAHTQQTAALHINIRKRLPIAAGLAGGSSNAAAVLLALNELAGYPLTEEELLALGATLGSDVPFCMVGGSQICRGRGEMMRPLACGTPLYLVVAKGKERVSTPRAFALMDEHYRRFDGSVPHGGQPEKLYRAVADGKLSSVPACIYNAFEAVILPTCPEAAALREQLLSLGAYAACMSGSGPSVFGLFETLEQAQRAAKAIGRHAHVATSAPAMI